MSFHKLLTRQTWLAFRKRYGLIAAFLITLAVIGPVARRELWTWFLAKSDLITVVAVVGAIYRLDSKGEHLTTGSKIDALSGQLQNGVKDALLELRADVRRINVALERHGVEMPPNAKEGS